MFNEAFRTLFLSTPAKLSHKNQNLVIDSKDKGIASLPLRDIVTIVIDTPQISLSASLLSVLAKHKILLFSCDDSHIPNGIFLSFLPHYRAAQVLQSQIQMSKQQKAILWQKIIKSKIFNQSQVLEIANQSKIAQKLQAYAKGVHLSDSSNNEAKASALYFPALFGKNFTRNDVNPINSALNYGYAIVRGAIARNLVGSGLLPSLGIFHSNQFNAFNLADDLIEPYRPYVDSKVLNLELEGDFELSHRVELVNILNSRVMMAQKAYPMHRAITRMVWSVTKYICLQGEEIILPTMDKDNNGRAIYESSSDV